MQLVWWRGNHTVNDQQCRKHGKPDQELFCSSSVLKANLLIQPQLIFPSKIQYHLYKTYSGGTMVSDGNTVVLYDYQKCNFFSFRIQKLWQQHYLQSLVDPPKFYMVLYMNIILFMQWGRMDGRIDIQIDRQADQTVIIKRQNEQQIER